MYQTCINPRCTGPCQNVEFEFVEETRGERHVLPMLVGRFQRGASISVATDAASTSASSTATKTSENGVSAGTRRTTDGRASAWTSGRFGDPGAVMTMRWAPTSTKQSRPLFSVPSHG